MRPIVPPIEASLRGGGGLMLGGPDLPIVPPDGVAEVVL